MHLTSASIDTPLGRYVIVVGPEGVTHFQPEGSPLLPPRVDAEDTGWRHDLDAARRAFASWFGGDCRALEALPLAPAGTSFQRSVWGALREIPAGATASYAEIARRVGSPGAARAVGGANHHNPIAIAIPCHRVIGSDGRLVGYAGGVERKRWLLAHEVSWAARDQAASSKSKVPSARAERAWARSRDKAAASI